MIRADLHRCSCIANTKMCVCSDPTCTAGRRPHIYALRHNPLAPEVRQLLLAAMLDGDARAVGDFQVDGRHRCRHEERDPTQTRGPSMPLVHAAAAYGSVHQTGVQFGTDKVEADIKPKVTAAASALSC